MTSTLVEPLFVLYGSQMGNSEQHAKEFCKQAQEIWTPDFFLRHGLPAALPSTLSIDCICMQLDDFLELHHAAFTKVIVIFVSSYGVGQAPLGSYRFRQVSERWIQDYATDKPTTDATQSSSTTTSSTGSSTTIGSNQKKPLEGLHYAICGLGDSMYTTYLRNPTTIDAGLTAAGATRIGDMGKADAGQSGDDAQDKVIARWMETMWVPVARAMAQAILNDQEGGTKVDWKQMQSKVIELLVELDPEYTPPKDHQKKVSGGKMGGIWGFFSNATIVMAVGVAVLGSVLFYTSAEKI